VIDEERAPFLLAILNDNSQAPMSRPMRMLDGCRVMIVVVIGVVVVVVGRGKMNVRWRQNRGPDGDQHQNRGDERTPPAACAHPGIMRVCRTPVNSTVVSS
jgi:hypothetical protein